jgi:predicted transcriptional regulator
MTTLPWSIVEIVKKLAEAQHRTKSEVVSDAIRGYARRFADVINNM